MMLWSWLCKALYSSNGEEISHDWRSSAIFNSAQSMFSSLHFADHVTKYTQRSLPYDSDILNGISGILRMFEDGASPVKNFYGVPISGTDFSLGLWWTLERPLKRRTGFPSWSWTGWIGAVMVSLMWD